MEDRLHKIEFTQISQMLKNAIKKLKDLHFSSF